LPQKHNLPYLSVDVKTKLIYDPKLKSYEKEFINNITRLYPAAGCMKIVLDDGLVLGFKDFSTQKYVVVASELIEKSKACSLLGYDEAEFFTDSEMIQKINSKKNATAL